MAITWLCFCLLFRLLHGVLGLGSMATIAATFGAKGTTVCAITGGAGGTSIRCNSPENRSYVLWSGVNLAGLAGGRQTLCALTQGGGQVVCWNDGNRNQKRISGEGKYGEIAVGDRQICGIGVSNGQPQCWRWRSAAASGEKTLKRITVGKDFACAISVNASVVCWGSGADALRGLEGTTMAVISGGGGHLCGIGKDDGVLRCAGRNESGQTAVPAHSGFEFDEVALGDRHSCARKAHQGSAVCWGEIDWAPEDTELIGLVSGDNYSCGVIVSNNSVLCWGGVFGSQTVINMTNVLPMRCETQDPCDCGEYPDGQILCPSPQRMCKACPLSLVSASAPQPAKSSRVPLKPMIIALGVVGGLGCMAGVATLGWFLYRKFRPSARHSGRVHDPEHAPTPSPTTSLPPEHSRTNSSSSKMQRLFSRSLTRRPSRQGSALRFREGPVEFPLSELSSATADFSADNKIGGGSFGTVYRGKLSDGRDVAVKRGDPRRRKPKDTDTAFDSELWFLSRLHHKHLVTLIGYCSYADERLLVYEYMPNGTLHHHLHGDLSVLIGPLATWPKRIRVALDAARGLEYLHTYADPPTIHRDIKSSNILLDSNWTARVSDFGLSLPDNAGDADESYPLPLTAAAGTLGYMDPEYYRLRHLTPKSDVYSFGVLLLEIFTGRKAIHHGSGGDGSPQNVVDFALPFLMENDVMGLLDQRIPAPMGAEAEAVSWACYVAADCVSLEGTKRPSMTDVVAVLERSLALCARAQPHPPSPATLSRTESF